MLMLIEKSKIKGCYGLRADNMIHSIQMVYSVLYDTAGWNK